MEKERERGIVKCQNQSITKTHLSDYVRPAASCNRSDYHRQCLKPAHHCRSAIFKETAKKKSKEPKRYNQADKPREDREGYSERKENNGNLD